MDAAFSFVSRQPDPKNLPEARTLLGYKNSLESMRNMFLFETDLRTITKRNIDMLESELRGIVEKIEKLRKTSSNIEVFISSPYALQTKIRAAIRMLYVISGLLDKKHTIKGQELLYRKLEEFPDLLLEAIEQFNI